MVRHRIALTKSQELPQRQAVGTAPFQAALAVDSFEVANQKHAEVAAGRQRRTTATRCVVRSAQPFDKAVKPGGDQLGLQSVVENVPS
jgi:hypothetical protein